MKTLLVLASLLLSASSAFAKDSELYVIDGDQKLAVEQLIADEAEIQAVYGFENFCYEGNADAVLKMIGDYKSTGLFFSGGGGGFEYLSGSVNRGIVTYDLNLKFADEVAEGEVQSVIVKPCSFLKR